MIDVGDLQRVLDGPWGWIREDVRSALCDPLFAPVFDIPVDEHRDRVLEQARAIAKTEGPAYLFPTSVGGKNEAGAAVTAFETQAYGDLSLLVKTGVQWGLFGGAITHLGTDEHHRRYLPDVMALNLLGCFAMTETGHGSDVQSLRTTATYDVEAGEFVIHTPDDDARKDYIGNAARHGHMAVVFAQLITGGEGRGVHAFLVPIRGADGKPCAGVSIEDCGHKAGLNGVDNGRLAFHQVRVPRDALLDRYGSVAADGTYTSPIESESRRFFTMLGTLVQGRVSVSGAAVSATKTALTIAVRYALVRRQFKAPERDNEIPLLNFVQHQRRLLPALASTYALHFAQQELISQLNQVFSADGAGGAEEAEEDKDLARRKLETFAAGLKATTTWHATHTIQTCREACGGAGYLSVNRLPQLKADTDVFTTFEGDNTVLLQLVAKTLLTAYQSEFGELDTIGTVRFVADRVVETVIERTGGRGLVQRLIDAVPGHDEEQSLLDRGYQLSLFEWREKHMIDGVVRRVRSGINDGEDPFDVFNSAQDHVLAAARAHIDRLVLELFVEAIDRCDDDEVKALLDKVCDLHVMSMLERDRAWFLEHGRLTPARAKAIISTVNELCGELREHAELLVDAFAIPDIVLAAPIALGEEAARQQAKETAPAAP